MSEAAKSFSALAQISMPHLVTRQVLGFGVSDEQVADAHGAGVA